MQKAEPSWLTTLLQGKEKSQPKSKRCRRNKVTKQNVTVAGDQKEGPFAMAQSVPGFTESIAQPGV
jgi:hypothetical protein